MHPLREARERRNLSQQALADLCELGLATIERAERGRTLRPDTRRRLSAFFGLPADALGLVCDGQRREAADAEATDAGDRGMKRRGMLAALGVAGAALVAPLSPASETFLDALDRPSIDNAILPSLDAITQSYWQLRAHVATPDLRPVVGAHLDTLRRLLTGYSMTPSVRARLCTLTGEVAQIAGAIAYDDDAPADALAAYRVAIQAARESGDVAVHVAALGRLTLLSNHLRDHRGAHASITEAVLRAGTRVNPTIRAWLAVVEAETCAHLRDVRGHHQASERAATLAGQVDPDEYAYWCGFDSARLTSYQGTSLVYLRRPGDAIPVLRQALALTDPRAVRRRATIGVALATAHVQRREYDAAAAVVPTARAWAEQAQSRVNLQDLNLLGARLALVGECR